MNCLYHDSIISCSKVINNIEVLRLKKKTMAKNEAFDSQDTKSSVIVKVHPL